MPIVPFGEYRPDVSDYRGASTQTLLNVLPRGDGYGPFPRLAAYSQALPAACRGFFRAVKTDGSVAIFAATSNRIALMDNSDGSWTPVSKVTALTSISQADPAVFTLNGHGLANGDALVLSTSDTLPTGLTVGTVYYVVNKDTNTFNVATTPGGDGVETTGAGSGTHSMTYFYSALSSSDNWQFAQFGDLVIAVQANVAPQVYDLSSATAFSDLSGSPPNARYISIVGRFVVLSGLVNEPYRVHWSGLGNATQWTSGTNSSDFQDLPDGGVVRGVAGGEYGVILQDNVIRRMTYVPGSPVIFQIERLAEDHGLLGPYSLIRSGSRIFYFSAQGFKTIGSTGLPQGIGQERVDRTFLADLDTGNLQLFIGASDPRSNRVFWAYKSGSSATAGQFNKLLCYDYALDRFSPIEASGEYIGTMSQPGITLETLDNISASIDALSGSLDGYPASSTPEIAAFDGDHKLGFFNGTNLQATLVTGEQGTDGKRIYVRGIRPITDAATVFGSVSKRENVQSAASFTTETAINGQGVCPVRADTRYSRGKIRIPSGTSWTFASGVELDATTRGLR